MYDRSVIMAHAAAAESHQGRTDCFWGEAIFVALKAAWQVAKTAHRAAVRCASRQFDRKRGPLMVAMDACNGRFGRGSVVPARAGLTDKRTWSTSFEMRSPRYTTQVAELPTAHA